MKFCKDLFWDPSLWASPVPDVTLCFHQMVLVSIACLVFLLTLPLECFLGLRLPPSLSRRPLPLSPMVCGKLALTASLIGLSLTELISVLLYADPVYLAGLYSGGLKTVTFSIALVFQVYWKRTGWHTSSALFGLWLLQTMAAAVRLYSTLHEIFNPQPRAMDSSEFVTATLFFFLLLAQLLLSFFADRQPMLQSAKSKQCPRDRASFPSRLTFWWCNRLVSTGFGRALLQSDIWNLSPGNHSDRLSLKFDKIWENRIPKLHLQVNIYSLIFKTFGLQVFFTGILKLGASLLTFVNPIILDLLLVFLSSDLPPWRGYIYAAIMLASSMIESILNNQYTFYIQQASMRARTCLLSSIFKKNLRMSPSSRQQNTTGQAVNLMALDSLKVSEWMAVCHDIWAMPLRVVISLVLLWGKLGPASLAGLVVILLMVPFNAVVTLRLRRLQLKVMGVKDQRMKIITEVLTGIQTVKLSAWELSFRNMIQDIRGKELRILRQVAYTSSAMVFSFVSAPFLVGLASFAAFILMDPSNILDANKAFVALSLFNILRPAMVVFPQLITATIMAMVSGKRINKYLSEPEVDPGTVTHNSDHDYAISMQDATLCWSWKDQDSPVLRNITLQVPPGSLVAIVGPVGSGKSALLSSLICGLEKLSGTINVSGQVSYCPQHPWIQNTTLRNNIAFTWGYEPIKFKKVVQACALGPDLEVLPGGDLTEIGEKGINLSGGQKQRISLARAIYSDAGIFLLDDPISAVDAHVGQHLFDKVIGPKGLLTNKTRILVTHAMWLLPHADYIYVLDQGSVVASGTYSELAPQLGALAPLLEEASTNQETESQADKLSISSSSLIRHHSITQALNQQSPSPSSPMRLQPPPSEQPLLPLKKSLENIPSESALGLKEVEKVGSVGWTVYRHYLKYLGFKATAVTLVFLVIYTIATLGMSLWLSLWSDDALDPAKALGSGLRSLRLGVYATLGFSGVILVIIASLVTRLASLRASKKLHESMLLSLLRAPMAFFYVTPVGRVLNRFSRDVDVVDSQLATNLRLVLIQSCRTLVALVLVSLESVYLLVALVPLSIFYVFVQRYYVPTSRQLKRLQSITRSPIYVFFSESLAGASCIQAFRATEMFVAQSHQRIDTNNQLSFALIVATCWLAVRLEFMGYIIVFLAAIFAVVGRHSLSPGLAGLSISYALTISTQLSALVRNTSDLETNIVSVERLMEYSAIVPEAPWHTDTSSPLPSKWPSEGAVEFNRVEARYRPRLPLVLAGVSFSIRPGEKVGVVGRTGAGKSSLTLTLFRLLEPSNGIIKVDGVDISLLGLHDLRSRLAILPQNPMLFTGSLRVNLDPLGKHSDTELLQCLEESHLGSFGLDHSVTEGGENLSGGQRQLVCLARALLRRRNCRLLVLDEATAAIDPETDALVQETLRREFSEATVITVAHRLHTVLQCDRVLVMMEGRVVEFDAPAHLLQDPNTLFSSLAKDAGIS